MRVAQRTISRNYLESMNSVLSRRAEALRRSEDGLRFTKLSEDVSAGARAMDTQETRYAALQQKNTAEALLKENESAWTSMGTADSLVQDVIDEMRSAAGVRAENKLLAIKKTIGEKKAQFLQRLNSQYGSKYLYGGTNNAEPPFSEDAQGRLTFNGVVVQSIYKYDGKYYQAKEEPAGSGEFVPHPPTPENIQNGTADSLVRQSGAIYLDVGYGLRVDGSDGVDSRTAIQVNTIGLDMVGFASFLEVTDADGTVLSPATSSFVTETKTALLNEYLTTGAAGVDSYLKAVVDEDGNQDAAATKAMLNEYSYSKNGVQFAGGAYTTDDDGYLLDMTDPANPRRIAKNSQHLAAEEEKAVAQSRAEYQKWANKTSNIYDLMTEVENLLLPDYSEAKLDDLQMRLNTMNDQMRMARTEVDTRATALEDMIAKLDEDISSMEKLEDSLMTAQPAEEAINLKDIEYAWKAVLAVGNQLLPSSLLDYLN